MPVKSSISEEDRRAATAVTTSGSGHRFEIQLGHLCNNRCVFCSSGQLTAWKIARPVPLAPILEALEQARAAGATHLTFVGGEPTIHKGFFEALTRAIELGFEHIVIFTNGVMFPHPGFIDQVTARGNFEWRVSIQGATNEAHVATTGRATSFERIVYGLGELQRRGQLVTANMCVTESNYRSLPHYPALLDRYGVRQLHVDIVRPESTGERDEAYLREVMPRYSDMAPYYADMLAGFERHAPDFDVNVGNLPYCILPAWGSRIHHGGQETVTKSSDGTGLEDEMNKYEWQQSLRTHLPSCAECVFRSRCTGVFRVYLGLYGGDEFQPVSRDALVALDPERRNFVLLVEPHLAPLRAALAAGQTPPGWRLRQDSAADRRRRVELDFAHDTGALLHLRVAAPGSGRAPVIRSAAYGVDAEADLGVPGDAITTLLEWVHGRLAAAHDSSAAPALMGDAVAQALRHAVLQRGRHRVSVLAGRLHGRFALPGWSLDALRWPAETTGELVACGPGGARVAVRFTLGARDARSQVGVDFHPAPSTDQPSVRPAIDALVALLRSPQPESTSAGARPWPEAINRDASR